ncbi:MAG: hypothetical protein KUL88_01710 [Rhizobium sp.]|nr:hypothetical protein [Rhizobium sp.]
MTNKIMALSMATAPKDNTLVRLLVDYSGEGDHPLEDAEQAWTVGFNNFEDTEFDEWQFAGWSWSQDCFCEGQGRVIGWAPFHPDDRLYDAAAPMADGGDALMSAAEEVLAWLLVEKIGVVDDVGYTPKQAQDIIVQNLDQAAKQLVDSGELLLQAESVIADLTRLLQAAKEVIACASDTYKKRNGHCASFEDDSGEKCWIVPFDAFEGMRSAVAALATTEGSDDGH